MTAWNPELYLQFANERTQPSLDLVARIALGNPSRIADLGCGPGNSTQVLHRRWPNAEIFGLDNSPEMIASAQTQFPTQKWLCEDAATWHAETPFDLVFSNALLHWLPNHEILFPHLMTQVARGGAFAVQVPEHYDSPFQKCTLELARQARWSERLEPATRALTRGSASFYYDLLQPLSARIDLWETEYLHVMDDAQSIVRWFQSTGLRPYLAELTDDEQTDFLLELGAACEAAYTRQRDGRVLFAFRRLFFVAYK